MKNRLSNYLKSHTPEMQGILWMIAACFWFASMASIIRHLTASMNPFVIIFFRNCFSVLCILPPAYKYGFINIRTKQWKLYSAYLTSGVLGMTCIFYAISKMPLTEVTALTFAVPLITAIFAVIFLKEKIPANGWIATIVGFIGILIILRPGSETFQFTSLIVLAATCCWSVSNILIKKLTKTDKSQTIVFIMIILYAPLSLPAALFTWQTPNINELFWLFILGWVSYQAQLSMTHAYSKTDISTVLPFDFSRLIFITAMSYIFFGEIIDIYTIVGAIFIFSGAFYIVKKNKKRNKAVIAAIAPADSKV